MKISLQILTVTTGFIIISLAAEIKAQDAQEKIQCMDNCMSTFARLLGGVATPTNGALCDSYTKLRECLGRCRSGDEMFAGMAQIVPKTYNLLRTSCDAGDPEGTVAPEKLSDILGEGMDAQAMKNCASGCESKMDMSRLVSGRADLQEVCGMWNGFERCIRRCPNGNELLKTAKAAFGSTFDTIESACGNGAGGSGSMLPSTVCMMSVGILGLLKNLA